MRVVNTKRTPDGRLQVLVQGLGRLRLLNETRSEPFPKVDAQLLVDAEALVYAETALTNDGDDAAAAAGELGRLRTVSAVARELAWWRYDAAGFEDSEGVMPGLLLRFNATAAAERGGVEAVGTSAEEAASERVAEAKGAWSDVGAAAAAAVCTHRVSNPGLVALPYTIPFR